MAEVEYSLTDENNYDLESKGLDKYGFDSLKKTSEGVLRVTRKTDDGGIVGDDYILNVKSLHTTPKAVSVVLEDAVNEISRKVQNGNFDAQTLPIIKEWVDTISKIAQIQSKIEEIYSKRFVVAKKSRMLATVKVLHERKIRIDNIKNKYNYHKLEKARLREEIEKAKKEEDRIIREASLRDKREKVLREYEKETLKYAFDDKKFRRNLVHQDKMDQQKRAHLQMEMDLKHSNEQKQWEQEQEQREKDFENESRATEAEYAARIAKSEREFAEHMEAIDKSRAKSYDRTIRALRYKQALELAREEGKKEARADFDKETLIEVERGKQKEKINNEQKSSDIKNDRSLEEIEDDIKILKDSVTLKSENDKPAFLKKFFLKKNGINKKKKNSENDFEKDVWSDKLEDNQEKIEYSRESLEILVEEACNHIDFSKEREICKSEEDYKNLIEKINNAISILKNYQENAIENYDLEFAGKIKNKYISELKNQRKFTKASLTRLKNKAEVEQKKSLNTEDLSEENNSKNN